MSKPTQVLRVTFNELFKLVVSDHQPDKPIMLHYIREAAGSSPEDPDYVIEVREFDTSSGESIKEFIDTASDKEGGFVVYLNSDVTTGYQVVDEETRQPL